MRVFWSEIKLLPISRIKYKCLKPRVRATKLSWGPWSMPHYFILILQANTKTEPLQMWHVDTNQPFDRLDVIAPQWQGSHPCEFNMTDLFYQWWSFVVVYYHHAHTCEKLNHCPLLDWVNLFQVLLFIPCSISWVTWGLQISTFSCSYKL